MKLIDDHGRIGGKVNLIDAIIASAVIGAALTAYGGYLLFRPRTPKLFTITPAVVYQGQGVDVTITGENLRPYLRVTFNSALTRYVVVWNDGQLVTARTYVRGNTTFATFALPDLTAGTYDVGLWNARQEVARLPKALTVLPLAPALTLELDVRGAFTRLSSGQTKQLRAGAQFRSADAPMATLLAVGAPSPSTMQMHVGSTTITVPVSGHVDVPATLRVECFTVQNGDGSLRCAVPGPIQQADVAPGSSFSLNGPDGWITFHISDVLPPKTPRSRD
jgi:uncharacterized protein DUF4330/IPT/TIG domain-containing protein